MGGVLGQLPKAARQNRDYFVQGLDQRFRMRLITILSARFKAACSALVVGRPRCGLSFALGVIGLGGVWVIRGELRLGFRSLARRRKNSNSIKAIQFPNPDQPCYLAAMKTSQSGPKDMKRRAEAALKRVQAAKALAPNGNAGRAHDHKVNKVQPTKQRNKLQKGR